MAISLARAADQEGGFADHLRSWRQLRRLSQLDLALASGVSQRHVSFLESGRAKPSRSMILLLCETLEVPLRDRNDWLAAAGFAHVFSARALDDPRMGSVMVAIRTMLANHNPFPALAVDRVWNIRMTNDAFERMDAWIGPDAWRRIGGDERNLMRLFFHPEGLRPHVANWEEIAPLLWRRATREAEALGGEDMKAILAELAQLQDEEMLRSSQHVPLVPVLPLTIAKDGVTASLFTIISTFGTAQDITTDELRIESLFPADEATDRLLRGLAAG